MGIERVRRVTAISAMVVLAMAAATGAMLTWIYVPSPAGSDGFLSESAGWSRQVSDAHSQLLIISAVLLVTLLGVTVVARERARATYLDLGTTIGALVLVGLAAMAWRRVQFDQLGLWAVTVGDDLRGLWFAAFSDQVRFVFLDGREARQSDIAPWVVAHLVAPFLALALLIVDWMASRPPRAPRRVVHPQPSG